FSSGLPIIGTLIARFRTLWNDIATRWYLVPILQQQMDFNGTVVRYAQQTDDDVRALEAAVVSMDHVTTDARRDAAMAQVQLAQERRRVADLEVQVRTLQAALTQRLDLLTGDVSARLDRLERRTLDGTEPAAAAIAASSPRSDIPAVD